MDSDSVDLPPHEYTRAKDIHLKLKDAVPFWFATYNPRGCTRLERRMQIDKWANNWKIWILGLQETKVNVNSKVLTDNYVWFFSSSVTNEARLKIQKLRNENKQIDPTTKQNAQEHLGTGVAIHKHVLPCVTNVTPIDNRILTVYLDARPPICYIVAYAPQALHVKEVKDRFWNKLKEVYKSVPAKYIKTILGDFNARLLEEVDDLRHVFGKHIFKTEGLHVADQSEQVQDNRERLIDFCCDTNTCIINTLFPKPQRKLLTHLHVGIDRNLSDLNPHTCDQCDFILSDQRWKNAFQDAESDIDSIQGSDHFPVWVKFRVKLKNTQNKGSSSSPIPRSASSTEILNFNQHVKVYKNEHADFESSLKDAAKYCIANPPKKAKKPWITDASLDLINRKHELEFTSDRNGYKQAAKEAQRSVKKDWNNWLHNITDAELDVRDKWLGIKYIKNTHAPKLYEKANRGCNKQLDFAKHADAAADYLEFSQWAPLTDEDRVERSHITKQKAELKKQNRPFKNAWKLEDFTLEELRFIIRKMKRGKAAGPDEIPMELFKWLDDENLTSFLDILNSWWKHANFQTRS